MYNSFLKRVLYLYLAVGSNIWKRDFNTLFKNLDKMTKELKKVVKNKKKNKFKIEKICLPLSTVIVALLDILLK